MHYLSYLLTGLVRAESSKMALDSHVAIGLDVSWTYNSKRPYSISQPNSGR